MKKIPVILAFLLFLTASLNGATSLHGAVPDSSSVNNPYDYSNPIKIVEALGPLASLSISPYFGFFAASGISILTQEGIIDGPEFLSENKVIGNYYALTLFFILTVITTFSSFFSSVKILGVAISYFEDKSSLLIASLLYVIPFLITDGQISSAAAGSVHLQAGFASMSPWLIFLTGVINLYIIQTTRFAFDLLTFITPVPFVDKIFEILKIFFSSLFLLLYLWNPWIPFIILIFMFFVSLVFYKFIRVRNIYFVNIYIKPLLRTKFLGKTYPVKDVRQTKLLALFDHTALCIPAFPKYKTGEIKKLRRCWLIGDGEELFLCKKRFLKEPIIEKIYPRDGSPFVLYEFLFEIKIWQKDKRDRFSLTIGKDCKPAMEFLLTYYPFENPETAGVKKAWKGFTDYWKQLANPGEDFPEIHKIEE